MSPAWAAALGLQTWSRPGPGRRGGWLPPARLGYQWTVRDGFAGTAHRPSRLGAVSWIFQAPGSPRAEPPGLVSTRSPRLWSQEGAGCSGARGRRRRAWGKGRGDAVGGRQRSRGGGGGRTQALEGCTPSPPQPLTRETPAPLCSPSLVTRSAPVAVCTVDTTGAGRAPSRLQGRERRQRAPRGLLEGGTGTGTWVGSLTGVRGVKSAGWEPAPGPEGGLSCSALRAAERHKPRWGSGGLQRP